DGRAAHRRLDRQGRPVRESRGGRLLEVKGSKGVSRSPAAPTLADATVRATAFPPPCGGGTGWGGIPNLEYRDSPTPSPSPQGGGNPLVSCQPISAAMRPRWSSTRRRRGRWRARGARDRSRWR